MGYDRREFFRETSVFEPLLKGAFRRQIYILRVTIFSPVLNLENGINCIT
jgi:hypothetical protein